MYLISGVSKGAKSVQTPGAYFSVQFYHFKDTLQQYLTLCTYRIGRILYHATAARQCKENKTKGNKRKKGCYLIAGPPRPAIKRKEAGELHALMHMANKVKCCYEKKEHNKKRRRVFHDSQPPVLL